MSWGEGGAERKTNAQYVRYVYGSNTAGEGAGCGVEEDVDALEHHANELKNG
jgi:hypothetical protein